MQPTHVRPLGISVLSGVGRLVENNINKQLNLLRITTRKLLIHSKKIVWLMCVIPTLFIDALKGVQCGFYSELLGPVPQLL